MGMNDSASSDNGDLLQSQLDQIITDAGGDVDSYNGKLVREIMHTATKLLRDGADTGELKLVSRSLKELRYAMKVFRGHRATPKVSIFGSARTPKEHPDYQQAVAFSQAMARAGWMVITGAGGGIMEAGHGGAGRDASFGVAIRLPFETTANPYITADPKLIVFRYFFTRKLMFASQSHAVVLLPGGFGTQDEGFEILTLIQTGKMPIIPIVMIDPPGGTYWKHWNEYVHNQFLANKLISPEDLHLYKVTDDVAVAAAEVFRFYRNYHSQRYVRDTLVLRIRKPLEDKAIDALNDEFADLIADGRIEQGPPEDSEKQFLSLPRIKFIYTKRNYGKLRLLIDRLNDDVS